MACKEVEREKDARQRRNCRAKNGHLLGQLPSAQHSAQFLFQSGQDSLHIAVCFGVGEGVILMPQLQGEGHALLVFGDGLPV